MEEYDVTAGRLIGIPQALSHLGVINTALGLSGLEARRAAGWPSDAPTMALAVPPRFGGNGQNV